MVREGLSKRRPVGKDLKEVRESVRSIYWAKEFQVEKIGLEIQVCQG